MKKYLPGKEQMELRRRGVEEILPENDLIKKLQKSSENSTPLIVSAKNVFLSIWKKAFSLKKIGGFLYLKFSS